MTKRTSRRRFFSILFTLVLLVPFFPIQIIAEENETDTEADTPLKFTDITLYEEEIYQLVELAIIKGYPDQTFRPNNPITRLQAITMLIREMGLDTSNRPDPFFLDVSPGQYGYDEIATAVDVGMISGKSDGTFDSNGKLTRGQLAKIMVEAYGLKLKEGFDQKFTDVPSTHWAHRYINILASNGITTGYADGTFKPEAHITRAHFALFLARYLNEVKEDDQDTGEAERIKKAFELKADKTEVKYSQTVNLTLEVDENEELEYSAAWKATGGKLTVAEDGNSADWKAENRGAKDYTVTVTIEVPLTSGETVSFEKLIKIAVVSSSSGGGGGSGGGGSGGGTSADSDKDGLSNKEEEELGTDPNNDDTDGDGLKDGEEVKTYKTDPLKADTDEDGLTDGEEIEKGLDPLKFDTDDDGLGDGAEESLGFDPLKQDTDDNGIMDGDEIIEHTIAPENVNDDDPIIPSVTMESNASGLVTTTITKLDEDPLLDEDIPGFMGPAFDFNTEAEFSEAVMTFQYSEDVAGDDINPEVFYFNEQDQVLERLENQTHDPGARSVTVTVNHFSKYILLDGKKWDEVWEKEIRPPVLDDDGNLKNLDIVFSIDSSGSMSYMDPQGIRKQSTKNFIDALKDGDRAAIVDFDDWGKELIGLTPYSEKELIKSKVDEINSSGGTNLYEGVKKALELFDEESDENIKYVIFLTDGDGSWNDEPIQTAKDMGVVIYTIGLGDGVRSELLERIATETGGKYYFASEADELEEIFKETVGDTVDYTKDEDEGLGDGIPDYLEVEGLRTGLGQFIYTDPGKRDTDGDGLLDGEEITIIYDELDGKIYFKMYSDPNKVDSDGDGINDGDENREDRLIFNHN